MNHGSLFSGIGGFDLAAEWMGWNNIFHCEWNPFGQQVLKYHFPNSISYADITKTDFSIHRGTIDILTGGFPCQPYSNAGKRLGKADERHLFPEMLRAIKEIQPRWIIGENVRGLVSWNGGLVFHEVYDDLERQGYEVQSYIIPAASVNAPHRRDRVWIIANSECIRLEYSTKTGQIRTKEINAKKERSESALSSKTNGNGHKSKWENFPTVSPICNGNDGIPSQLDRITFSKWRKETIKAGGNAIVPQVALQIFKAIQQFENEI
jgi:DNA (cytosine-5)-methyltransferase 1